MFSYSRSLDYTYCLNRNKKIWLRFGFDRMRNVLERIGNPQDLLKTVHIAGTKGKGSTLSFLSFILREKLEVGAFTSPSLINTGERISVNGHLIVPHEFSLILDDLRKIYKIISVEDMPSTFETFTIASFIYFLGKKVDLALYEVGMGGRLDATNIIKSPLVSIITEISFDHQKFLGNSLEEIAMEKSGIIKKGVPLVIGRQEKVVSEIIVSEALKNKIQCFEYGKDYFISDVKESDKGVVFDFYSQVFQKHFKELVIPMTGYHQAENASSAIQTVLLLKDMGYEINEKDIYDGLAKSFWPGRLEIVSEKPFVILDGAHNRASSEALTRSLKNNFSERIVFLFSMLKDKNIEDTLSVL
ncbi:MAG: Mur ligase family protein, partial [Caldisericota bacterium]|nr:Mur ligase family protein [Caldisericota bacterium]